MRALVLAAALAAGSAACPDGAAAQENADAISWLQRIYRSTERLSYTGTFVYQQGEQVESSRITRIVDASGVHERLEALDGTPREIVRVNEEVKCYLPQTMTVKVERQADTTPFPAMRADARELVPYYDIRKGETERIAGYDCQSIILEPKDKLRYGHKLWADLATGMLVKAKTFNEKHEVVEQFTFTQLQIGGRIERDQVKSRFAGKGRDWRVESAATVPADLARHGWLLRSLPAGYRKITEMKRNLGASVDVGHIVLSDGLAAMSVFIEPLAAKPSLGPLGPSRQGAVNVYTRKLDGYLVTVVGEVPAESVKLIANSLEYRRPQ
ncbi:MAG TPA: MucB/RseB C-terminal domain-containing protein [Burkholderiales bacterium]|nr:MucB/RseB C-terminal domain-containing protein [Burkholderiales bacterium]